MPAPSRWQAWKVRHAHEASPRSTEGLNDGHPWVIATPDTLLKRRLFIGVLQTHSSNRGYFSIELEPRARLIGGSQSQSSRTEYICYQNVHTLTTAHIRASPYVLLPPPNARTALLKALRERFSFRVGSRNSPWDVGRMCTIKLNPSASPSEPGDLSTLKTVLANHEIDWLHRNAMLPAVIVASDEVAPAPTPDRAPWRAVTVVPLILSEKLQAAGAPWLPLGLRDEKGDQVRLSALTRCVLTVHYDADPKRAKGPPRVQCGHDPFADDYVVPARSLKPILAAVQANFPDHDTDGGDDELDELQTKLARALLPQLPEPAAIPDATTVSSIGALVKALGGMLNGFHLDQLAPEFLATLQDAASRLEIPGAGRPAIARARQEARRKLESLEGLPFTLHLSWNDHEVAVTLERPVPLDVLVFFQLRADLAPVALLLGPEERRTAVVTAYELGIVPTATTWTIRVVAFERK